MTDTRIAPAADWRAAVWAAHRAGTLTRAARDVLLTLATFRGPGGRIWPSHALLAARASCCVKTVLRAMQQARAAGLLTWRAIRWQTPGGFWRRKSNLYALRIPAAAPKGHSDREGEKAKIQNKEAGSGTGTTPRLEPSEPATEDALGALKREGEVWTFGRGAGHWYAPCLALADEPRTDPSTSARAPLCGKGTGHAGSEQPMTGLETSVARKAAFVESLRAAFTGLKQEGLTTGQIADEMNRRGIRTRLGARWTACAVRSLFAIIDRTPPLGPLT